MTLTFVSLGLSDKEDITVKGLNAVKSADFVYLEHYTSVLGTPVAELEEYYGQTITLASRTDVEGDDNIILANAKDHNVVLLVVGDAFSATTHSDLFLRAKEQNISVDIVYNASILTAVGSTGLQLYKFGKTTSMVFFDENWKPDTAYKVVAQNKEQGFHTLCLLDIKVAEPTKEDLAKENYVPQEPRFMTIKEGLEQYLEMEAEQKRGVVTKDTLVVGVARIGCPDELIKFGTVAELMEIDFGGPLHSLIIPGNLHFHEEEVLEVYR